MLQSINNLKISIRLNLILGLLIVVIISSLGIYIYSIQKREWNREINLQLKEQLKDVVAFIDSKADGDSAEVAITATFAKDFYFHDEYFNIDRNIVETVRVTDQSNTTIKDVRLPQMNYRGEKLYKNYRFLDLLSKQTNTFATIFQKIDDGYLRITTTVTKEDGERAVNTFIPNSSPVAQAINRGETFSGRAFVVKEWCYSV